MNSKISEEDYAAFREAFQRRMIHAGHWQTCLNCANFNQHEERCLKFNARPPAMIIATGCKDWKDEIPF